MPLRVIAVSRLGRIIKRLLVRRAMRSDRLGETLLPKRVALPVLASDALLSVAPGVMVTSVPWQMRSSQCAQGRFASVPVRFEGLEEPLGGAQEALEVAVAGPEGDRQ
jgi:hypothetical protein